MVGAADVLSTRFGSVHGKNPPVMPISVPSEPALMAAEPAIKVKSWVLAQVFETGTLVNAGLTVTRLLFPELVAPAGGMASLPVEMDRL